MKSNLPPDVPGDGVPFLPNDMPAGPCTLLTSFGAPTCPTCQLELEDCPDPEGQHECSSCGRKFFTARVWSFHYLNAHTERVLSYARN